MEDDNARTDDPRKLIAKTKDRDGCAAVILYDPKWKEWWWEMADESETVAWFDTREDAERMSPPGNNQPRIDVTQGCSRSRWLAV